MEVLERKYSRTWEIKNYWKILKTLEVRWCTVKKSASKNIFCRWKSLKSHKGIPYTHRFESGNDTFQNMPHMFSGLENAFAGPGWTWKHKKWKDQTFLHRNYIPKFFSTLTKNFFCSIKKFSEKIRNFLVRKIFCPQNRKKSQNFKMSKFQHFEILTFFRFCGQIFFGPKMFGKFFGFFFDRAKKYFLSELRNFLGYSFDVKMSDLFIFYAFRFIRARQTRFLAR